MKLLFVITQLYKAGAETALINLFKGLSDCNHEIDLIILNQFPVDTAISLIPEVPSYITVCDQWTEEHKKKTFFDKVKRRIRYELKQQYSANKVAKQFVQNKVYDWAFHIGEWSIPLFVAKSVTAHNKAIWIHADLSKIENFSSKRFFKYDTYIDQYIFVSENSRQSGITLYGELENKSTVIYNLLDVAEIHKQAKKQYDDIPHYPYLLTCANIRAEKNHLMQVEIMYRLKNKGVVIKWLNVGSKPDTKLFNEINKKITQYGMKEDMIFLGSKKNPYPYIQNAYAVTVLSEHESWSMVITEAKVLGVPVIATKTSGALEQLENNVSGVLTDFDVNNIVESIYNLIENQNLHQKIRQQIRNFDNSEEILKSFEQLLVSGKR